jgi:hypothetical protein
MSECLVYQLKPGKTIIGNIEGSAQVAIRLSGSEILEEHCVFTVSRAFVRRMRTRWLIMPPSRLPE